MRQQLTFQRTAAAAGLAAVLGVFATGCGGGGSASGTPPVTTAANTTTGGAAAAQTTAERALITYATCMRGKGVNIPDPVKGANGRYAFPRIPAKVLSAPGVRAKAQACAAKLPQNAFRRGGAPSNTQRVAFQKFATCMQQHGVTFGRPGGSQGQRPTGPTGTTNPRRGSYPFVPGQRPQGQRPGGFGGGFLNSNDPKVKAALAKCRSLLPTGFQGPGRPTA